MSSKRFKKLPEKTLELVSVVIEKLIPVVKKNCTTKFDESIDLSFQINNKQKKSEVNIRTVVNMPGGTGKKIKVENTPFDFRKWKILGNQIDLNKKGFDENFIVNSSLNARLYSPQSGILLTLHSNQPGLQFYTGQHLNFKSNKKKLIPFQGLCLETQSFPNSPNNNNFPSTILKPNNLYKHKMKIKITYQ